MHLEGGGLVFFTSCIIIAFFCFAFYLIWNQFLKKDTRLSAGLKALKKKISELQNLSIRVENQMDRQMSTLSERSRKMESLLQKTKDYCERMEKNLKIAKALEEYQKAEKQGIAHLPHDDASALKQPIETRPPVSAHLKMVQKKDMPRKKRPAFGESPFTNLDFIENPSKKMGEPSP